MCVQDGGFIDTIDRYVTACRSPKNRHLNVSGGDCRQDAITVVKRVLANLAFLMIGFSGPSVFAETNSDAQLSARRKLSNIPLLSNVSGRHMLRATCCLIMLCLGVTYMFTPYTSVLPRPVDPAKQ